jgi:uncharacterized protein YyaL (SSP411 family)
MPNRLASQKSPYLRQHADNPVDWYPWGPEALALARHANRPLLVSIGYSSCHWCHVMAHESFEDAETAALMNGSFVNVKVDREERPDVDAVYMEAVQAMTGQGGWPLNVFLTPEGRPFFGGTYFPPEPRHGLPSWRNVLERISEIYRERPDDVARSAAQLTAYVERAQNLPSGEAIPGPEVLASAYSAAAAQMDWTHGGFGGAPKFPQPLSLEFVLRMYRRLRQPEALRFVEHTLTAMARGGVYDQLGGGFHRYSVDAGWVVPHFEKMLYDNALLAPVYLHTYQLTGDALYRRVAEETLDYLLREMRSPEGGLFSAQDADSEGEEGKYYVWTREEIMAALSPEQARAAMVRFGVRREGNFEGRTILTAAATEEEVARATGLSVPQAASLIDEARAGLLKLRARRVPPGTDTKILTSWNALAIRAFAEAGAILDCPRYLDAAQDTATFLLTDLHRGGTLLRSYQNGPSSISGFLEDYAFLTEALIVLYETTGEPSYLEDARRLLAALIERFSAADGGPFFDAPESTDLVVRPRSFYDNPIPSGNASVVMALLRLEALTGDRRWAALTTSAFRGIGSALDRAPQAFSYLLSALDFYHSTPLQIAVVGDPSGPAAKSMLREVWTRYLPNSVVAAGPAGSAPLLEERDAAPGGATAYVCRRFTCNLPARDPEALATQLDDAIA